MFSFVSADRWRFLIDRFRERLWARPLVVCLLSIVGVFVAKLVDSTKLGWFVPEVAVSSVETLLSIMSSSMLVIATFSLASMVSAYAAASSTATPRSFTLILKDDVSQNALSTFIGAFIFSIVATTALRNQFFDSAGIFVLFALTILVFGIVIVTFVGWADRIARLGRLGSTIETVEDAAATAIQRQRDAATMHGSAVSGEVTGRPVFADEVGRVQHIDLAALQNWAETSECRVVIAAMPGAFVGPERPLAFVCSSQEPERDDGLQSVVETFEIGRERSFDSDPRFGLTVLSEIAVRALSPAVNDPGTAIEVLESMVRLFTLWSGPPQPDDEAPSYDRIEIPAVRVLDMLDDAFLAIGRDGAGLVEVAVHLQGALGSLASLSDEELRRGAEVHARLALKRARRTLDLKEDFARVVRAFAFGEADASPEPARGDSTDGPVDDESPL